MNRFSKFSWFLLVWTVLVIAWGTVVRATNSGAGCGNFWPLCGDSLIPTFEVFHTIVEFSHRVMSGLLIIFVIILFLWGRKIHKSDPSRIRIVNAIVFFTLFEALLGAGLVLFGLVEDNSSNLRIVAVSIHLLNTFILLGVVATNAWWSNHTLLSSVGINRVKKLFYGFLSIIAMIGVTGAITALADTLFPSTSMMHTLSEQFQKNNHILISLRILHPILAILLGFAITYILINYLETDNATINKLKVGLWILILLQFGLGFSNIIFLTPVFIQVIHLVIADIIWILTVFLFLSEPIIRIKNHE